MRPAHALTYLWMFLFASPLWLLGACSAPAISEYPSPSVPVSLPTQPVSPDPPTLADFWHGLAEFRLEIAATGLPMGESDTLLAAHPDSAHQTLWSYIHASHPSAGVIDQCGKPVEFPGCIVVHQSQDEGRSFQLLPNPMAGTAQANNTPTASAQCLIPCAACPCTSARDHIDQQQYPRVKSTAHLAHTAASARVAPHDGPAQTWLMVYEYRANVILRRSTDGLTWSPPEELSLTGIWQDWLMPCPQHAGIGDHPFTPRQYDCLVGSPPGLYIDLPPTEPAERPINNSANSSVEVYVFVGLGQNPGAMGCYRGPLHAPAALYRQCNHNPLFVAAADYGPLDDTGPAANAHFDFRTISSAEVIQIDDQYYMLYEGVRGPHADAPGDTQFALGLARTTDGRIDGPWETFTGNPILVDNPGNVGLGHADLLILDATTYLYTSLDGQTRSRLILTWRDSLDE